MSDFYCSGCCKWAAKPHVCPGRQFGGKSQVSATEISQREKLLRRKSALERELNEINQRLGVA